MSGEEVFEPLTLPLDVKEDLCRSLLAEFGVTRVIHNQSRHELTHACVMPDHDDRNPSAGLNYESLTYKCLAAETMVKTYEGDRRIGDLAGQVVTLLDGDGKWVQAPVRHYGKDRLYRVTMSRNGVVKEVYATADHRWLVRPQKDYSQSRESLVETTTMRLRPRHRIPSVWPMKTTARTVLSPVGIMAGFVFGDGTRTEWGARAYFVSPKDDAMLWRFVGDVKGTPPVRHIEGFPRSWKDLPALDEGLSYLYGWLAGYFAADGCVSKDGTVRLSSASRAALEFARTICDRLGIATSEIGYQDRTTAKVEGVHRMYALDLKAKTLVPEFFLLPTHRERFMNRPRKKYDRTHWWVVSVEETDRHEDVYCAEVPTTHSFVLAGNVLTGNCFSCQSSGGLLWLIATVRGTSGSAVRDWLVSTLGLDGEDTDAILRLIDAIMDADGSSRVRTPIPSFSPRVLEPWAFIHPWLTDPIDWAEPGMGGRGVPEQNVVDLRVGYAEHYPLDDKGTTSERIVVPHFWDGRLVGWQSRKIFEDGSPKWLSTMDFPKDETIFRPPQGDVLVVVESPMTVLRHAHHLPLAATFGADVTDRQVRLMSGYDKVVLWMDPDRAGWRSMEGHTDDSGVRHPGLVERLMPYTDVWAVQADWANDGADLSDEDAAEAVAGAVPASVWERPERLRCVVCRQVHSGDCREEE